MRVVVEQLDGLGWITFFCVGLDCFARVYWIGCSITQIDLSMTPFLFDEVSLMIGCFPNSTGTVYRYTIQAKASNCLRSKENIAIKAFVYMLVILS